MTSWFAIAAIAALTLVDAAQAKGDAFVPPPDIKAATAAARPDSRPAGSAKMDQISANRTVIPWADKEPSRDPFEVPLIKDAKPLHPGAR